MKDYTFIIHNVNSGGGGLEHLNSTSLLVQRNAYSNENTYNSFLSLVAHEYFHLWNVKRLRPIVLGPFDYNQENYTKMLWVSEGFTAYYDNWIVRRAGFFTPEKYLDLLANDISNHTIKIFFIIFSSLIFYTQLLALPTFFLFSQFYISRSDY